MPSIEVLGSSRDELLKYEPTNKNQNGHRM